MLLILLRRQDLSVLHAKSLLVDLTSTVPVALR